MEELQRLCEWRSIIITHALLARTFVRGVLLLIFWKCNQVNGVKNIHNELNEETIEEVNIFRQTVQNDLDGFCIICIELI